MCRTREELFCSGHGLKYDYSGKNWFEEEEPNPLVMAAEGRERSAGKMRPCGSMEYAHWDTADGSSGNNHEEGEEGAGKSSAGGLVEYATLAAAERSRGGTCQPNPLAPSRYYFT